MKSIKITPEHHQAIKIQAAKSGEKLQDTFNRVVAAGIASLFKKSK